MLVPHLDRAEDLWVLGEGAGKGRGARCVARRRIGEECGKLKMFCRYGEAREACAAGQHDAAVTRGGELHRRAHRVQRRYVFIRVCSLSNRVLRPK